MQDIEHKLPAAKIGPMSFQAASSENNLGVAVGAEVMADEFCFALCVGHVDWASSSADQWLHYWSDCLLMQLVK